MKQYSFEKLKVWQKSKDLAVCIYKITEKFPDAERFGLTSQIRRSCVSISSNIAEGTGRNSSRDQARFYEIAFASLMELLNQLVITHELDLIKQKQYYSLREEIEEISRMLNALKKSKLTTNS